MIERDRELLARLSRVNSMMGAVVVELIHREDHGALPAEGLRDLGGRLGVLGAELVARADELDCPVIDGGER